MMDRIMYFIKKFRNGKLIPTEEYEQLESWAEYTSDYHKLVEANEILEYKECELKERNKELKQVLTECRNWLLTYRDTVNSYPLKQDLNDVIKSIGKALMNDSK